MKNKSLFRDLKIGAEIFSLKRNLEAPSLLTWPFISLALAFFIFGSLVYKTSQYAITPFVAAVSEIAASLPFIAVAVLYRALWTPVIAAKAASKFGWFKIRGTFWILTLAFLTGALRGALADEISYWLSPANSQVHLENYVLEGLTFTYFVMVFVTITGARRSYRSALGQLQQIEKKLQAFYAEEKDLILTETAELRSRTSSQITPKLQEILEALNRSSDSLALVELIKDALKNTVRPLGNELHSKSKENYRYAEPAETGVGRLTSIPKRLNPKIVFNPTIAVLFFSPLFVSGAIITSSIEHTFRVLFQLVLGFAVLQTLKALMPDRDLPLLTVVPILILAGLTSDLPSTAIIYWISDGTVDAKRLYIEAMGISPIWFLIIGYLLVVYHNVDVVAARAKLLERTLKIQRNLLQQNIWIERRNWSYLVHGTVQSSLTASMARLALGQANREQAILELKNILETIKNPPKPNADLLQELKDLELTWSGVAHLIFDISTDALEILSIKPELRFAVNEILKEAVSNAVRHGASAEVKNEIRIEENLLIIDVSNESQADLLDSPQSLGSKMFDELTTSWSLTKDKTDGLVHLRASLQLS